MPSVAIWRKSRLRPSRSTASTRSPPPPMANRVMGQSRAMKHCVELSSRTVFHPDAYHQCRDVHLFRMDTRRYRALSWAPDTLKSPAKAGLLLSGRRRRRSAGAPVRFTSGRRRTCPWRRDRSSSRRRSGTWRNGPWRRDSARAQRPWRQPASRRARRQAQQRRRAWRPEPSLWQGSGRRRRVRSPRTGPGRRTGKRGRGCGASGISGRHQPDRLIAVSGRRVRMHLAET